MTLPAAKAEWRARLLRGRRARSAADRAAAQAAVTEQLLAALGSLGGGARVTVCLYLPLPSEPLAAGAPFLVARHGYRVLVPVTTTGAPLDWCELPGAEAGGPDHIDIGSAHDAALVPGPLGVPEPSGTRLGPSAILGADVVVVPALAVDPAGFRLGRGGGFYDRSLALLVGPAPRKGQHGGAGRHEGGVIPAAPARSPAPRIAVIFDDEADLPIPHEAHDARVTHVLTPAHGLRRLT